LGTSGSSYCGTGASSYESDLTRLRYPEKNDSVKPSHSNRENGSSGLGFRRHDWVALPALALFTMLILGGVTELTARAMFPRFTTDGEDCITKDPALGARGIPHSVCWEKIPEGEPTQYRYNSSGYRADQDFVQKQAGTYRIVMIGTSPTIGMRVPREKTFAALLPAALSQRTGFPVEIYNEAIPFRYPDTIASHFDEFLENKPDLIVWTLNVGDLRTQGDFPSTDTLFRNLSLRARAWQRIRIAFAQGSLAASLAEIFSHTRSATLLSHIMYSSQSEYVTSSLMDIGKVPYLQENTDPEWRERLEELNKSAIAIVRQAKSAGVPLVVVFLPNHLQSAMITMADWPIGLNPYKLNDDVRSMITRCGGTYIDIMPGLSNTVRPDLGFFLVEGHPNPRGHATLAHLLTDQLTTGAVPALRTLPYSQAAMTMNR
jgi:hypothetical protein